VVHPVERQPAPSVEIDQRWFRRRLEVGGALTSELDHNAVLEQVLQTARQLTGARYAAHGILNEQHTQLESLLTQELQSCEHRLATPSPGESGSLR
jgi:hypothetical protein